MTASNYEEWKESALNADKRSGAEQWKQAETSDLYANKVIRRRYDELVSIRQSGDIHALLFYLNEGIHGNMGGMGAPTLYTHCQFGTKKLIHDYIEEVVAALELLRSSSEDQIDINEKLDVFKRANLCYGRSALMLSGAGSQGPFHIGVVKALCEQGLIPTVISGASAGSIIAGIIGTCLPHALLEKLNSHILIDAFKVICKTEDLLRKKQSESLRDLTALIETLIPDMTFAETYEESGHYINVCVAAFEFKQRSRLLNAVTSPNALVREALLASCAIPGVFPAVQLAARDRVGNKKPYVPSRKWVDGSITLDLPTRRLSRLYSVNHFISSQTNPLVAWALQDPSNSADPWSRFITIYQSAAREWLRAIYPLTMEMIPASHPQNVNMRMLFDILTQEYTADITILPKRKNTQLSSMFAATTSLEANTMIADGESATWPKIEQIRLTTAISRKLDQIMKESAPTGNYSALMTCPG